MADKKTCYGPDSGIAPGIESTMLTQKGISLFDVGPTSGELAKSRGKSAIVSLALVIAIFLAAFFLWDILHYDYRLAILFFSLLGIVVSLASSLMFFAASIWHATTGLRVDPTDALSRQWFRKSLAGIMFILLLLLLFLLFVSFQIFLV